MSKMLNIFLLSLVILLVLRFSGILVADNGTFLGTLDLSNPANFEQKVLWTTFAKIGALVIAGAAVAVLLGQSLDVVIFAGVTAGLSTTIFNMLKDLTIISSQIAKISPALAALIISPLLLMGIFGIIDWYKGKE
jgi:hypothetical protein